MRKREVVGVCCVLSLALISEPVCAKVSGQCGNCHTMHNSQDGGAVVENRLDGSWQASESPNPGLLKTNCIGCHLGVNSGGAGATPYVLQLNEPTYNNTGTEADTTTLAGGSFYWVGTLLGDAKGHNVDGIAGGDARLGNSPPGGTDLDGQLTCAGSLGCHGDRTKSGQVEAMLSSHHYNDMTLWKDGSTLAKSYRFLYGVKGLEDSLYEYRPTVNRHNKYYGVDRSSELEDGSGTVGKLCAQCHNDFHQGNGNIASGSFGAGVWLRHPTNFDMGTAVTSSEYDDYNGGSGTNNPYSVIAPVGTTSITDTINSTVYSAAGDAIVMCLSCHRAHGTPHAGILRWDYKSWPAGGYNGCAICHATKD
ncbi:MAG: cytochrome c3 family protein [Thermodesulfobacteriota bacterium]